MAFPQIAASATSSQNTETTTQPLNLPAGISAGDLLVAICIVDGNTTIAAPDGWSTIIANFHDGGTNIWGAAFYKIAAGDEGASTTYATGSQQSAAICYRITGHDSGQAPEGTTSGSAGTSDTANPPSLTPTGGAKDYLWITASGKDTGDVHYSAFPTNYVNTNSFATGGASPSAGVGIAYGTRELNAASEDPGNFTLAEVEQWVAMTIAIHPSAGGGGFQAAWARNSNTVLKAA